MSAGSPFKLPRLKLRGTIVLAAAAIFTVAIAGMLFYVVRSTEKSDIASADQLLTALAQAEAAKVAVVLKQHSAVAESVAETVATLAGNPLTGSDSYKRLLERQIEIVPNAVGVWVLLNKDSPTANNPSLMGSQFRLDNGYFGASIQRDPETAGVFFNKLDMSEEAGFQTWYLDPLAKGSQSLVGPYLHHDKLFTSSTAVVRDNAGRPIGLAGVDFNGALFAMLISGNRPLYTGWVGIINQDNNWVVPPDQALIGKPAGDATAKAAVAGARQGDFHETVPVEGADWRITSVALDLPEYGIAWTVLVGVPETTLLADAVKLRNALLVGGGLVLALGLVAFTWLGASVARPVSRMTGVMRRIAEHDYVVDVPYGNRRDEIGDMAKALAVFRAAGIEKLRLEGESEEARRTIDLERSAREAETLANQKSSEQAVNVIGQGLHRLSEGDLVQRLDTRLTDDADRLRLDFNLSIEKLQKTMLGISKAADAIRTGIGEITSASDDLSRRTEHHAASLEETAAALNHITDTVRQTADGATHARAVVSNTRSDALGSAEIVRQAIAAMAEIEKSSREIGSIIGVIDEIAFQTNLLALNAGVEAARAGEAGRGFAVVASEVRSLAQRSAEAAKEIKELIANSTAQVDTGVKLVAGTGEALDKIVAQVNDINGVVDEIAAKAIEQANSLREVNVAVGQMDQVTQQNAAMVEEATAASHGLARESQELVRLVGQFTVTGENRAGVAQIAEARASRRGSIKAVSADEDGWQSFVQG